jgi:hypothetical protein
MRVFSINDIEPQINADFTDFADFPGIQALPGYPAFRLCRIVPAEPENLVSR